MRSQLALVRSRVLQAVPIVLGIIVVNFLLLQLAPGDLADVMAAQQQISDPKIVEQLRNEYGLDKPAHLQLLYYLWNVVQLDLGYSFYHNRPVLTVILERLPATLLLMGASMLLAVTVGVAAGVLAALRVNKLTDNVISVLAVVFFGAPSFWVGLMMMVLFSVKLGLLPVAGMATVNADYGFWGQVGDVLRHLLMPMFALGLFYAAIYTRVTRASMLEVYGLDFVRTARAKGLSERRVALKHVLRNALLPVVTLFGLQVGTMLAGSVVIEAIFSWPGIGTLIFDAVVNRNLPLVVGVLFLGSILVVVANLAVDLLYMVLDPRVEMR